MGIFGRKANELGRRIGAKLGGAELRLNPQETHCFLSHAWSKDEQDRDTHARVSKINRWLNDKWIDTWFDEKDLHDDITRAMTSGIDNTKCVVVFITKRYIEKVNGTNPNDNCKREFEYAERTKGVDKLVSVVFEPAAREPARGSARESSLPTGREWEARLQARRAVA